MPLPAGGDVRCAYIINHGHAQIIGQGTAIAQLHREPYFRAVNNRLAMEADDIDSCRVGLEKILNGLHMPIGQRGFRLRQSEGPFLAAGKASGVLQAACKTCRWAAE